MTPPPVFQLGIDFEKGCQLYVCSTWSRLFAENWNLSQPPPLTTNYNVSVLIGTYGDPSKQEYPKNWKIDYPPPSTKIKKDSILVLWHWSPPLLMYSTFFVDIFCFDDHLLTSCLSCTTTYWQNLICFILLKPLKQITSYLLEPLWQKTYCYP